MGKRIAILGAGCAGLGAAHELRRHGIEAEVYEKNATWGGLCRSFTVDGYTFDTFAHVNFATDPYVYDLLEGQTPYLVHAPEAMNYSAGNWIRNPVQNNLIGLPVEERISIITSFIERRKATIPPKNYGVWLEEQYGAYFAQNYPARYTRKYWTVEPEELEPEWAKSRMYAPSLEEVLRGAMSKDTPNVHYTKVIHYPNRGGYQSFLAPLASETKMHTGKVLETLDAHAHSMRFTDGTVAAYDDLVSTIPLPELVKAMAEAVPSEVRRAAEALDFTGGITVSVALDCPSRSPTLWFYIYDEDIYPARVYAPEIKSPNNVPEGCSAYQAEIYMSRYKGLPCSEEEMGERVAAQLMHMRLFSQSEIRAIDVRKESYANIMFTPAIYGARKIVCDYVASLGIHTAGRFGTWDYLWTGGSILSGRDAARAIMKNH